ncbi:MAG: ATP-binding protein [Candidatus Gracilibacteria bacterium]|nr:ATP-binding protein [Candidatus Gracilibacteria bacterium]
MTSINIKTYVQINTKKVGIYTSLVEAIVNGIHGIEELGNNNNGKIIIELERFEQETIDKLSEIKSIKVIDNGIGFNNDNFESFDKIHTEHKIDKGGKGFGRLTFLKFFEDISISSFFSEESKFYNRSFNFTDDDEIINNPYLLENLSEKENSTTISFKIRRQYIGSLDKQLKTIARKLFEKLLVYFVADNYICPQIILKDEKDQIILNEYLDKYKEIQLLDSKDFILEKNIGEKEYKENFTIKLFKVYFSDSSSTLNFVADNRVVEDEKLDLFIPEFSEGFSDEVKDEKGNITNKDYVIKAYVLGNYLNETVLHDREGFDFENKKTEIGAFKKDEIYNKSIEIIKQIFKDEYNFRKDKKIKRIKEYINNKAFWHKPYINSFDYTNFGYSLGETEMELELQKLKFKIEQETNKEILSLREGNISFDEKKRSEIISKVSNNAKSDLIHYIVNRRLVLDFLIDLLRRNEDGSVSLEEEVHNVIYPMGRDSSDTNYEDHNLWLLDERLVFSHYIASDKKISKRKSKLKDKSNKEPDLIMFDVPESYRLGDNSETNPITIFEFKRPKRTSYGEDENPIIQIAKYLEDIKAGKYETPDGFEKIKADEKTPAYGYIIADITDKIKDFAKQQSLTLAPDGDGYFGFLPAYGLYIEIISYSKLVKNAELRNKIFFKRLGII